MRTWTVGLGAALVLAAAAPGAQSQEEFARRQYESGLSFMQNRKYVEALKDFQAVLDSFPKSAVADNALLQMATYQLEVTREFTAAQAATDRLLKEYPETDSAPMAHVVAGRLTLARGHAPADVDAALASFERVRRLFPGDEAVPTSDYYAGETLLGLRRNDEALDRFRRVAMEYPRSIWAARSALSSAFCLAQSGSALRALDGLQRVRQQFPASRDAAEALSDNSIIYRLFVRGPAQPSYAFSGRYVGSETAKFKDVVGVAIDDEGRVFLGHRQGVAVFDAKATLVRSVIADGPSALFLDERRRLTLVRKSQLIAEGGEAMTISVPTQDGKTRIVEEIASVVVMSNGDRLIADHKGKAVIRVSAAGKYLGNFISANAERLAINRLSDIALIDKDAKTIVIADRDGRVLARISQKGTGYEFDNPVDLAYDALGHLYVLDRGRSSVFVFGAKNRLIATITVPEKDAGSFPKAEALALDGAGRLYIFDDRTQRIQVYQ